MPSMLKITELTFREIFEATTFSFYNFIEFNNIILLFASQAVTSHCHEGLVKPLLE
jgi:hypothetical protein